MATRETIDKVKSLLEGHCYGPLKEAAEKWLAVADEKYGDKFDELKEKAGDAYEKLEDFADKYSDASIKVSEKMAEVSDKLGDAYDKLSETAGPACDKLGDLADKYSDESIKAGEKISEVSDKLGDAYDKLADKAAPTKEKILEGELVKQLKEGICTVGDLLDTFGDKDAADKFGEEFATKMKEHANALKEKGEQFCDCDACKKARSILKDFGEDIEEAFGDKKEE